MIQRCIELGTTLNQRKVIDKNFFVPLCQSLLIYKRLFCCIFSIQGQFLYNINLYLTSVFFTSGWFLPITLKSIVWAHYQSVEPRPSHHEDLLSNFGAFCSLPSPRQRLPIAWSPWRFASRSWNYHTQWLPMFFALRCISWRWIQNRLV